MSDKKEELRNFLDAMVDDNQEQAQVHFHSYLEDKMKDTLNPQPEELEVEDDEVSDGSEEVKKADKE